NTAATQMARVGATLSDGGAVRLERLRGFGAGFGRALTCQCSRLALADATGAVLVAAAERAGPDLSLDERARRLLDGIDTPFAVFAEDGRLIHATPAALERIGVATDLIAQRACQCRRGAGVRARRGTDPDRRAPPRRQEPLRSHRQARGANTGRSARGRSRHRNRADARAAPRRRHSASRRRAPFGWQRYCSRRRSVATVRRVNVRRRSRRRPRWPRERAFRRRSTAILAVRSRHGVQAADRAADLSTRTDS